VIGTHARIPASPRPSCFVVVKRRCSQCLLVVSVEAYLGSTVDRLAFCGVLPRIKDTVVSHEPDEVSKLKFDGSRR
jgi:hypothetical protein